MTRVILFSLYTWLDNNTNWFPWLLQFYLSLVQTYICIYFCSIASKDIRLYKRSRVRFLGQEPELGVFRGDERNFPSGVRTHDLPIARDNTHYATPILLEFFLLLIAIQCRLSNMYQICTIVFTEKRYELSIKTVWNILINI